MGDFRRVAFQIDDNCEGERLGCCVIDYFAPEDAHVCVFGVIYKDKTFLREIKTRFSSINKYIIINNAYISIISNLKTKVHCWLGNIECKLHLHLKKIT